MIIYLYGLPAVGKNYIGKLISEKYNYYFKDGDDYLPTNMKNKLKNKIHFTLNEVREYHYIIARKLKELSYCYDNIVISQASLFKEFRNIIKKENTSIIFVNVVSDIETILKRIDNRKGYVTRDYAIHLQQYLQVDSFDYILENNSTNNNILEKNIDNLLDTIISHKV